MNHDLNHGHSSQNRFSVRLPTTQNMPPSRTSSLGIFHHLEPHHHLEPSPVPTTSPPGHETSNSTWKFYSTCNHQQYMKPAASRILLTPGTWNFSNAWIMTTDWNLTSLELFKHPVPQLKPHLLTWRHTHPPLPKNKDVQCMRENAGVGSAQGSAWLGFSQL